MTNISTTQNSVDLPKTYSKIYIHILPYLFICYLFNYFDRVNVGFGKLQMLDDLHLTETVYGLAAGIFFIGYVLFGVPSNLVLYRVGARRWLTVLMIFWGIFSTSLMFVKSAKSFYVLRFLTGASEAGFFPGIILYFSTWFPSAQRGRITALFMSAIPISGVLGSPFSGWVLHAFSTGVGGLAGWQWLYLVQGVPTILLAVGLLFLLNDGIDQAKWLSEDERVALKNALIEDEKNRPAEVSEFVRPRARQSQRLDPRRDLFLHPVRRLFDQFLVAHHHQIERRRRSDDYRLADHHSLPRRQHFHDLRRPLGGRQP